jgi:hypothetical protein
MTVYSDPVFNMAVNQFAVMAIRVGKVRAAKNTWGLFP